MSPDSRSDQELIVAHQAGDERAFARLVERYLPSIYRFLVRFLTDQQSAEDIAQETFLKAWKHLASFDGDRSFKAWIFSIARHNAIDHLRKHQLLVFSHSEEEDQETFVEQAPDPRPLADTLLEQKDLGELLEHSLRSLSPAARTVVLLHETEELTFQEIAEVTKEPMNTVKSRYRRALLELRRLLESTAHAPKQPRNS